MYENRSQSAQETTMTEKAEANKSPIMMRRKDSLKTRKSSDDILKEEKESKSQVPRQQSLDPQAGRKAEVVAPTPKRTSTVFGKNDRFIFNLIDYFTYLTL